MHGMSAKTVGRIYLRREKDYIHLLSIKTDTKRGDIYFSMPVGDSQMGSGIINIKSSYHLDGQTHLTVQVPALASIDDGTKRSATSGLGFSGDKVYLVSEKNAPLTEIDEVIRVGQGGSFNDINSIPSRMLKVVKLEKIKWGSVVIDTRKYKHLSLNYFVVPRSKIDDASGYVADEYCLFPHPSLDLLIVVRIFDFWDEKMAPTNESN